MKLSLHWASVVNLYHYGLWVRIALKHLLPHLSQMPLNDIEHPRRCRIFWPSPIAFPTRPHLQVPTHYRALTLSELVK